MSSVSHNTDVIGCDLNQATEPRGHDTSALYEAMRNFCKKRGLAHDVHYHSMYGQPCDHSDVCGFIILPTGRVYEDLQVDHSCWMGYANNDIGIRKGDAETHYPLGLFLKPRGKSNKRYRTAEATKARKRRDTKRRNTSKNEAQDATDARPSPVPPGLIK